MLRLLFTTAFLLTACNPASVLSTGQSSPASSASRPAFPFSSGSATPPPATPQSEDANSLSQDNLIANPGAEQAANIAQPLNWTPDSWGTQNANLSWESSGSFSGQRYLSATVQNHIEGDAKWVFTPLPLEKNSWYEYSDFYRSDGRNRLISACQTADGRRYYQTVWQTHRSESWQANRFRFYHSGFRDCTVTIMHVLDRNGWLHTDHHRLRKVEAQPLKRPLISISFDDIWTTAATAGAAELEKRGWKGSFYIAGKFARLANAPEYAHVAAIQKLIASGHEIGSHSNTHPLMATLNNNDIIQELQSNYEYLKFLGQAPDGIAYPFGDFSEQVETETQRFHSYARTSLVGLNDRSTDRFRLRIVPVTRESSSAELQTWVEDAERTSTWVIFLFHDLQDSAGNFEYTTSLSQYIQLLDFIQRRKLTVLPVRDALKEL